MATQTTYYFINKFIVKPDVLYKFVILWSYWFMKSTVVVLMFTCIRSTVSVRLIYLYIFDCVFFNSIFLLIQVQLPNQDNRNRIMWVDFSYFSRHADC
jgi:hypothetical protein